MTENTAITTTTPSKRPRTPWDISSLTPSTAQVGDVYLEIYSPVNPPPSIPNFLSPIGAIHPQTAPPPLIYHMLSPYGLQTAKRINNLLPKQTNLPISYLADLCTLGAVYLRIGRGDEHTSPRATRTTLSSLNNNTFPIGEPIYARIYVTPKRYTARTPLHLLHEDDDLVVVCKPAGLPTAATADNAVENVVNAASKLVGHKLKVTTRLDVCTSGVLILAKTASTAKWVHAMMGKEDTEKRYVVWTKNKPPLGMIRHWFNKRAERGRGVVKEPLLRHMENETEQQMVGNESENWVRAIMQVEDIEWEEEHVLWRSVVRLYTGRTHQIRMQMAAVGAAVQGDEKYQPIEGKVIEANELGLQLGGDPMIVALHALELKGRLDGTLVTFRAEVKNREGSECNVQFQRWDL